MISFSNNIPFFHFAGEEGPVRAAEAEGGGDGRARRRGGRRAEGAAQGREGAPREGALQRRGPRIKESVFNVFNMWEGFTCDVRNRGLPLRRPC